ncbi:fimbrial protein [Klebsiella aerogenes]|uniref:fimbrial protein n=1 Tax=Klebsiella aerogenes TaxID=548 RepID=UPI00254A9E33|nr:fimbrial protein [Klebsiella aerogenes]EKZ5287270.1 type 1 fimbrial protein [Klebsiella aerogenes]MDK7100832.1 fimbrial protein [Klebsiella aerogenes]MDK7645690.1 fimbrial protein [Klebsiella aerogenes]MDK7850703.1 fimbrial protein [Klebsiella aerogenes]MDK8313951.1 fimbrial protein [Klebsiella aerogenes]
MSANNIVVIVVFCLFSFLVASVLADEHIAGWGRVNMQGSITDTACAIAVNSREQTIDMGVLPLSDIIRDGQGRSQPFSIDLVNCITERPGNEGWKKFQVTFDGEAHGGLFGVNGDASGVALQIIDTQGNVAMPGKAMPPMDIIPGDSQLNYAMRLVANNHALKAGDYLSSIRFKLDYF